MDENNVRMGKGNVICVSCIISSNVRIGDFNIFISMTTIGPMMYELAIAMFLCLQREYPVR